MDRLLRFSVPSQLSPFCCFPGSSSRSTRSRRTCAGVRISPTFDMVRAFHDKTRSRNFLTDAIIQFCISSGFEGTLLAIYGFNRPNMRCSEAYCHFKSPVKFLEEFDVRHSVYWIDLVALSVFFISLRLIAFFVLKWKLRSQH